MNKYLEKLAKFQKADRKMYDVWHLICDILEYICVALVFIAVIITLVHLLPELGDVFAGKGTLELMTFLEDVLTLAIGIEFMKLFAHPSMSQVLETVVFLVSRHMLVGNPTPTENLLSSLSIILLVMAYLAVRLLAKKTGEAETEDSGQSPSI